MNAIVFGIALGLIGGVFATVLDFALHGWETIAQVREK